jgi:hypothetical protein
VEEVHGTVGSVSAVETGASRLSPRAVRFRDTAFLVEEVSIPVCPNFDKVGGEKANTCSSARPFEIYWRALLEQYIQKVYCFCKEAERPRGKQ